jgi:hypothetical protein
MLKNDYTVCIKRERQAVSFCLRSSRCFFNNGLIFILPLYQFARLIQGILLTTSAGVGSIWPENKNSYGLKDYPAN